MDLEGKIWSLSEKFGGYLLDNADEMARLANVDADSEELDMFCDKDAIFMEELKRDLEEIVDEAREIEKAKLRAALQGGMN